MYNENQVFEHSDDPENLKKLELAFLNAIIHYPLAYIKHRTQNFICLLKMSEHPTYYAWIWDSGFKEFSVNLDIHRSFIYPIVIKYLHLFPAIFCLNIISFILIIIYSLWIMLNYKVNKTEFHILSYISLIS